jgi:hypothetical protein
MAAITPSVPDFIMGYRVVEFGCFAEARLPIGYLPPSDGSAPLKPVKNVALCKAEGIDGYYTLFCTQEWAYVTYCYDETCEHAKRVVVREFGSDVVKWQRQV